MDDFDDFCAARDEITKLRAELEAERTHNALIRDEVLQSAIDSGRICEECRDDLNDMKGEKP